MTRVANHVSKVYGMVKENKRFTAQIVTSGAKTTTAIARASKSTMAVPPLVFEFSFMDRPFWENFL